MAFGAFMWLFLPGWVIAFNDDFAYLRSVVATVQHGRPWTDDFLEPWSLSLVVLCAAVFQVTGSFLLSTLGLQVLLAAVAMYFLARLVFEKTANLALAIGLSALTLTFPTALWKLGEFGALVVYWPALVCALYFAARNRWFGFLIAYGIAIASRQSALVWLVVPAVAAFETALFRESRRSVWRPIAVVFAGAAWFCAVALYANRTHAQRFLTAAVFSNARFDAFCSNASRCVWIVAVAVGFVQLLLWLSGPGTLRRSTVRRLAGIAIGVGLAATVGWVGKPGMIAMEHPFFDFGFSVAYLRLLTLLAAVGWAVRGAMVAWPYLAGAGAAVAIVSLRLEVWDYYICDAVLLAITGALVATDRFSEVKVPPIRFGRAGAAVLMVALLGVQLASSETLKRSLDERAGFCAVLERALRARWMAPTELSHAPFGFVAWHLLPYYLAHEGKDSGDLAGFGIYVAEHSVDVRVDRVGRSEAVSAVTMDAAKPFAEIRRVGWFGYARFWLQRNADSRPARVALDPAHFHYPRFPLDDAEWRTFIAQENISRPVPMGNN